MFISIYLLLINYLLSEIAVFNFFYNLIFTMDFNNSTLAHSLPHLGFDQYINLDNYLNNKTNYNRAQKIKLILYSVGATHIRNAKIHKKTKTGPIWSQENNQASIIINMTCNSNHNPLYRIIVSDCNSFESYLASAISSRLPSNSNSQIKIYYITCIYSKIN